MPDYVLNRNYTLRTLAGRIINFNKGEPTWVTPECEKDALAIGAEPVDGPKNILGDEEVPEPELTAEERREAILKAYAVLEARNERGDFTGQGLPNTKALEVLTKFNVPTKERDALWLEYKQGDE